MINLVGPVVDRVRVIDLLAKPMDHFRRSPSDALTKIIFNLLAKKKIKKKIDMTNKFQSICIAECFEHMIPWSSAPTTSGPEWASASLQTYSSCHWAPADSLF